MVTITYQLFNRVRVVTVLLSKGADMIAFVLRGKYNIIDVEIS